MPKYMYIVNLRCLTNMCIVLFHPHPWVNKSPFCFSRAFRASNFSLMGFGRSAPEAGQFRLQGWTMAEQTTTNIYIYINIYIYMVPMDHIIITWSNGNICLHCSLFTIHLPYMDPMALIIYIYMCVCNGSYRLLFNKFGWSITIPLTHIIYIYI